MKSYISSIGTATPQHSTPQNTIAEFMANALRINGREKVRLQALYRASGIKQRYSVIEDYGNAMDTYSFYPNNEMLEPFPTVSKRMGIYKQEALGLALAAIEDCLQSSEGEVVLASLTHLITVSCTGMYAPGIDIEIVQKAGLRSDIKRTAINFMGCYAAFNAIKVAEAIVGADPKAKALIVCVELCSIHFQKENDPDNILSNALFGDGAAAIVVQATPSKGISLSLEQFHCDLNFEGKQEMAWHIGDHGFEMRLSAYVPDMIRKGIRQLTDRLLECLTLTTDDIHLYAIHPGGKRILEAIEQALGLTKEDNRYAYEVLNRFGNMSSPTVLFVLKALLIDMKQQDQDKNILSFAFGPGLTLESLLLKVNYSK